MGLFSKINEGGFMDVIRCDESDYLVWKWHPTGQGANTTKKENSIRWNSSLRVKDGEIAIFVYKQKTGAIQDVIVGPYDEMLQPSNFPVLTNIIGFAYQGNSPFQAEVYFINMAGVIQIPFAVPYFSVFDPRFDDFSCPVAVRGKMTFSIGDYNAFIKKHRLIDFSLEQFSEQVKDAIRKYAKSFISNAPSKYGIPVVQLERYILELSNAMKNVLTPEFEDDFAVTLKRVDLSSIDCDKDSEEYQKLYKLTGKQKTKQVIFETDLGLIQQAVTTAQTLRNTRKNAEIDREDQARRNKLSAETEYMTAHVIDKRSGGFLQKIGIGKLSNVGVISDLLSAKVLSRASSSQKQQAPQMAPPPMPGAVSYMLAVNGQQYGPYNMQMMQQMADAGQLTAQSLVWCQGMAAWEPAGNRPDLASLFAPAAPPMPPTPPTM